MPLYLLHGFRWPRSQIRIFIILNDLEDASADYVQNPATIRTLRSAIFHEYPYLEKTCPNLTFVEQHDPEDLRTGAQPFAFVADTVREAGTPAAPAAPAASDGRVGRSRGRGSAGMLPGQGLSIDVGEAMGRGGGLGGETWDAMADLRDAIAKEEGVGWFAVWNGDVERRDLGEESEEEETEEVQSQATTEASTPSTSHGGTGRSGSYMNGMSNGRQGSNASGSQVCDEDMIEADDEESLDGRANSSTLTDD